MDFEKRLVDAERELTRHGEWWQEQWRRNRSVDRAAKDREDRLRSIESWKNTLAGKLAVYAMLGAMVGAALMKWFLDRVG